MGRDQPRRHWLVGDIGADMGIQYRATEAYILTEPQETAFVNFVTGIWPGTPGNIQGASLRKEVDEDGTRVMFAVRGIIIAATTGDLPPPPFTLTDRDGDYRYEHVERVQLTGGQISAFATFLASTWSGNVGDVERVSFTRTQEDDGSPGIDILARITGILEVATPAELPDPPVKVIAIT